MEAAVLEPKAVPYWNLIKDASIDIKFALISLLNESIRIAVKPKSEKKKKELSAAEIREQKTKEVLAELKKMKTDKTADVSWVREIVKNVPEMDSDVDYDKIKYDYLMEKYG
jgi:predicted metal-dependent peptidase